MITPCSPQLCLHAQLAERKAELGSAGLRTGVPEDGEVVDEEDFYLIKQERDAKKSYRRDFEDYRKVKVRRRRTALLEVIVPTLHVLTKWLRNLTPGFGGGGRGGDRGAAGGALPPI
jgi:hypothetical protein